MTVTYTCDRCGLNSDDPFRKSWAPYSKGDLCEDCRLKWLALYECAEDRHATEMQEEWVLFMESKK